MWPTISSSVAIREKFTMFGPQQTAGVAAGSMPFFSVAPPARSWQMHDLASTRFAHGRALLVGQVLAARAAPSFSFWYCRDAVQIGRSVNSVLNSLHVALRARAAGPALGDAAPAGLLARRGAQVPERQPEGRTVAQVDVAVAWRRTASRRCSSSTLVTSGTSRNGVAQPVPSAP